MDEVVITVEPEGRRLRIKKDSSLLVALQTSGVSLRSECGGRGICGKCKVQIQGQKKLNNLTEQEKNLLTSDEIQSGHHLACQIRVHNDLLVMIPAETRTRMRQIQVEGVTSPYLLRPAVRKLSLVLSPPNFVDNDPDAERILNFLEKNYRLMELTIGHEALKKIPKTLREANWKVTLTIWDDRRVIDIEAGSTLQHNYGVAIDVGTSKIVGHLINLNDGRTLSSYSIENPQIIHGEDVISRITATLSGEKTLNELTALVVEGINKVTSTLCTQCEVNAEHIYEMTVVGNSAMHHILLNIPPRSLAITPYVPVLKGPLNLRSQELGININNGGNIYLPPLVAGFVGSDDVANILSTGLNRTTELTLLIDIGTNTEVNLGNSYNIMCCSCASGPAFEGGHISHGMKAVQGAIEKASFDTELNVNYEVIGEGKPIGICGSGMIDILAEMFRFQIIDRTGRFCSEKQIERLRRVNETLEYVIAWKETTNIDTDIVITQKDIRELQMAKAAIYTGCHVLMKKKGISVDDLKRILLAGAFGNYITPQNAIMIGLIPDIASERVIAVGNTALSGAKMALLSTQMRREALAISRNLKYIELGAELDFNNELIAATYIPHQEFDRFPSVKKIIN